MGAFSSAVACNGDHLTVHSQAAVTPVSAVVVCVAGVCAL